MTAQSLTERELAVLKGIAADKSYAAIAFELEIGFESVKRYSSRLRAKLGAKTRLGLALWATKNLKGDAHVDAAAS